MGGFYFDKQGRKVPRGGRKQLRRKTMGKKPLVKLIKQVAVKQANALLETKYVTENLVNLQFNSGVNSGSELYSLIPPIGPGTGTYQRVGIDITPMRVKNTWVVALNNVSRSINIIVDLWCLIDKERRYYPDVVGGGSPQFLRTGNSSGTGNVQGYNGFNTDAFRMINKERYTLLKHFRFQLVANVGLPNNDITNGNVPNVAAQSMRTVSYVVDVPKQYRYNPAGTLPDYPAGHAPFWCLGYSHADGSPIDNLNQDVNVSWFSEMIYKDA